MKEPEWGWCWPVHQAKCPATKLKSWDTPASVVLRTPRRVAKVSMPFCRSPSTSGRSLVTAITTANRVTNVVMNLRWHTNSTHNNN
eukprot:1148904-Pelagomonas_calceolata.AAC.3